jgi:flavin reductase (DIM6/NTAB) family NADH-FMN oxidoreductase RutF
VSVVEDDRPDPGAFERIAAELDYPMYVVTAAAGADRAGCLVGFASQCSIDPARMMVWLSRRNRTYRVAQRTDTIIVHLLREGDHELAELFGGTTGDDVDKFDSLSWQPGPGGAPVLADCDWFGGRVLSQVDGGDHVGFLVEPVGGAVARSRALALGFQAVRSIDPGHGA